MQGQGPSTKNPLNMKKQQKTVNCGYCGMKGHNKTGYSKRKMETCGNPLELIGESRGTRDIHANLEGIHEVEVQNVVDGDGNRAAQETNIKKFQVKRNKRDAAKSSNVKHVDQCSSQMSGSAMQSLRRGVGSCHEAHDTFNQKDQPHIQPPSMFQQIQNQCQLRDMTQNLTIQGNTVHVRQSLGRTISRSQLEAQLEARKRSKQKKT